ncbi:hypothetical protein TNIN_23551 [Trichonephila inaurata madagascariensis]|uniref:Uncharacterized protein n=1 Tax=Trichonephila inaurata madagascariensis TaxID=2747483 RepID=A0A8X6MJU0_9ARAC|nr:hypothetical protein TNIN_23551 [Trichonephila inaurata madagascariensis]
MNSSHAKHRISQHTTEDSITVPSTQAGVTTSCTSNANSQGPIIPNNPSWSDNLVLQGIHNTKTTHNAHEHQYYRKRIKTITQRNSPVWFL